MKAKAVKLDGELHNKILSLAATNKISMREQLDQLVKQGFIWRSLLKSPILKRARELSIEAGAPELSMAEFIQVIIRQYYREQGYEL